MTNDDSSLVIFLFYWLVISHLSLVVSHLSLVTIAGVLLSVLKPRS